jgi:hypothetical protein
VVGVAQVVTVQVARFTDDEPERRLDAAAARRRQRGAVLAPARLQGVEVERREAGAPPAEPGPRVIQFD